MKSRVLPVLILFYIDLTFSLLYPYSTHAEKEILKRQMTQQKENVEQGIVLTYFFTF